MDSSLIAVAIISGVFGIISIQLIQYNYFKKKRFDFKISQAKKLDTIKLQQVRKEMGISKNAKITEYSAPEENNIIDLIKNVDMDKIRGALSMLQGGDDEEESPPLGGIAGFIEENPDMVNSILQGLKDNKNQGQEKIEYE